MDQTFSSNSDEDEKTNEIPQIKNMNKSLKSSIPSKVSKHTWHK